MTASSPIPDGWLVPTPPRPLDADERFTGLNATVGDFWRWAFSDLRDNYLRGVLAEFLVAAALGRTETLRKGWDNYDILTSSGIRVEVKASGYLQSWPQAKPSSLNFGRVIGRSWDENTNQFGAEPEVRADVFVFAVHTCTDHAVYDVLDVGQWEFYVVSGERVRECSYKTVGIAWVRGHAQAVSLAEVPAAIEARARSADSPTALSDTALAVHHASEAGEDIEPFDFDLLATHAAPGSSTSGTSGARTPEGTPQPDTTRTSTPKMQGRTGSVTWVLDYAAMGSPAAKPRYLHRPDCSHPPNPRWRPPTEDELATLPACADCQRRDTDEQLGA